LSPVTDDPDELARVLDESILTAGPDDSDTLIVRKILKRLRKDVLAALPRVVWLDHSVTQRVRDTFFVRFAVRPVSSLRPENAHPRALLWYHRVKHVRDKKPGFFVRPAVA
jgi:hypothetical protein